MAQEKAFATCHCHACAGRIEFNLDGFDPLSPPTIGCPHCGQQTELYLLPPSQESVRPRRVTLKKSQLSLPAVKDLLDLIAVIEEDGVVTEAEARTLAEFLERSSHANIAAFTFLAETLKPLAERKSFTALEAYQIQIAVERVLPKDIRARVRERRLAAADHRPASPGQLEYLRDLGGEVRPSMTREEASASIRALSGATTRQLNYIRDLGGDPDPSMSKEEASVLIDDLLSTNPAARHRPTPRQLMVLRFWNRLDLAETTKEEITEWTSRIYDEDPRRKLAWEIYKTEIGDDGSKHDPTQVPIGIGESYLEKAAGLRGGRAPAPARTKSGCLAVLTILCVGLLFLVALLLVVAAGP